MILPFQPMMTIRNMSRWVTFVFVLGGGLASATFGFGQPTVTVRLADPTISCITREYCLDVEFICDEAGQEIYGMNVRFFYNADMLSFVDFREFQGGYGPSIPNPPELFTSDAAGPALFNFDGPATFVNGAVQLVNSAEPSILLDDSEWTSLFRICFTIEDLTINLDTFCPSVVWDLEQDPANGGFLAGDDGVVFTVTDPDPNNESAPAFANVVQYNWNYTGDGAPPYGEPVDSVCINANCLLPLTIISFHGELTEDGILLQWETLHDSDIERYGVQRCQVAGVWKELGHIGQVESGLALNGYQFIDAHPANGSNYYRIQQRDYDGRLLYSPIIRIYGPAVGADNKVSIFPNPANEGFITVQFQNWAGGFSVVRIFDPTGQMLREVRVTRIDERIPISELTPGVYSVCIYNDDDYICNKIVIGISSP